MKASRNLETRIASARRWLVLASLSVSGASLLFFLCAPSLGFPLEHAEAIRLLQLTFPVFLGYLGMMTHFIFSTGRATVRLSGEALAYLELIVRGPVVLFAVAMTAVLAAFGLSNSILSPAGAGMSIGELSTAITTCLGILTASTSAMVAGLFADQAESND